MRVPSKRLKTIIRRQETIKKTMKYYDEIQACIGSDPNIKPVISLESGHVSADDSSGDESGELSSADGKPKKRPVRKRKSHSSAAEMLEFMNRYAEKREKVEEEKLNLMKEMQNDKEMAHRIRLTVRSIDSMYILLSFVLQGGIVPSTLPLCFHCLGKGIADLE